MKILHVSDLHIGKRVNEYSMLDDQRFALKQILSFVDEISPDAVIIAGDVYDKSVPSAEAVELLDRFLFALAEKKVECFIISGNHDSDELNVTDHRHLWNGSAMVILRAGKSPSKIVLNTSADNFKTLATKLETK
ncbi:MAG: exonuclease subunit SbcD [Clostridia bacterium]|nr:exonuclease subunit SbcD [Clostridia bacterium]